MKTSITKTTAAWNSINWAKVQRIVFKLQKRIYQASLSGQNAKARKLQKLLVKSYYAKLLAIRKVTQDNQGRKTAGVMDNGIFEATEAGTPQGGVISPLLANIALDGMIELIKHKFPKKNNRVQAQVIRYADDFVVVSSQLEIIQQCQITLEEWLKPIGLELKPSKTRICHTLKEIEVNGEKVKPGFDFLGWNFLQYQVGKHHSSKSGGTKPKLLGFKTLIKPSKKAIKAHADKVKEVIKTHKTAPQYALIKRLNPVKR